MANLYLIRHGQTDWNAQSRLQGSIERPLNEEGRRQAKEMGEQLAKLPIQVIYSSPMERAKETAQIIAAHHDCELCFDPALREASYGVIEGLTHQEYHERFKTQLAIRHASSPEERKIFKVVPDAESLDEVAGRALPCLQNIVSLHQGKHVVVVTHGGVIRTMLTYLAGYDDRNIIVSNTGIVHIQGDLEKLSVISHQGVTL